MNIARSLIATLLLSSPLAQSQTNPSFEAVSRCFFIYASLIEAGRNIPHPQLFQFGQPRIGWVSGYVQANQNNARFKDTFESRLPENKRYSFELQARLKRAVLSRNRAEFNAVLAEGVSCDRIMGIETGSLPDM
jgi:hypothetical protein